MSFLNLKRDNFGLSLLHWIITLTKIKDQLLHRKTVFYSIYRENFLNFFSFLYLSFRDFNFKFKKFKLFFVNY